MAEVLQMCPAPRGPPGQPGQDGTQGPPGRDGRDGQDGCQGEQGEQGVPGEPGADGEQGVQGCPGPKGQNGLDGKDGADGGSGITSATLPITYVNNFLDMQLASPTQSGAVTPELFNEIKYIESVLDQDVSTTASPTFNAINLTNQPFANFTFPVTDIPRASSIFTYTITNFVSNNAAISQLNATTIEISSPGIYLFFIQTNNQQLTDTRSGNSNLDVFRVNDAAVVAGSQTRNLYNIVTIDAMQLSAYLVVSPGDQFQFRLNKPNWNVTSGTFSGSRGCAVAKVF